MSRKQEIVISLMLLFSFITYLVYNVYNNVLAIKVETKANILELKNKIKENDGLKNFNIKEVEKQNIQNPELDKDIEEIEKHEDLTNKKTVNKIINAILLNNISNKELEEKLLAKIEKIDLEEAKQKTLEEKNKIEKHKALCQNLMFQPNAEELLKKNGCDLHQTNSEILDVKKGKGIDNDYYSTIKYKKRLHPVKIWKNRLKTIIEKYGNDKDKVLDLLTIMTMECNNEVGQCFNGNDIGPFQINQVHKERYNHSYKLYVAKKWDELFDYQLDKASKLIDSYRKTGCSDYNIKHYGVGNNYDEKRWRCIAFRYNGHPKYKYSYNKLGYQKRKIIEEFLKEKGIIE